MRSIQAAEALLGSTEDCADLCGEMSALCDELVFPNQLDPEGPVWVEHLNKPEWGRGTLVRRSDKSATVWDGSAIRILAFSYLRD